ncbi:MAG: hypothetical protein AB7J46_03535 [Candidatus Altimarinota bacterium]
MQIHFQDQEGDPLSTALDIRVSLWDSYEFRAGDVDAFGALNTSALHYGGYFTTFSILPDQDGYFFGSIPGLYQLSIFELPDFPVISPFNAYLQLEYKLQGSPDTEYLVYDFMHDPPLQSVTRFLIDQNAAYYTFEAGPRTSWNEFTLDVNNNASTVISLKFGEVVAKTIQYHLSNGRFEINDDVSVTGTLTTSLGIVSGGTVNFASASVGIGTDSPESALQVADGYYAQFSDQNAGTPPSLDCDDDAELGRLSIDTANERLYICNGAARGWDHVDLVD